MTIQSPFKVSNAFRCASASLHQDQIRAAMEETAKAENHRRFVMDHRHNVQDPKHSVRTPEQKRRFAEMEKEAKAKLLESRSKRILTLLKYEPMTARQLQNTMSVGPTVLEKALRHLRKQGRVTISQGMNTTYWVAL